MFDKPETVEYKIQRSFVIKRKLHYLDYLNLQKQNTFQIVFQAFVSQKNCTTKIDLSHEKNRYFPDNL